MIRYAQQLMSETYIYWINMYFLLMCSVCHLEILWSYPLSQQLSQIGTLHWAHTHTHPRRVAITSLLWCTQIILFFLVAPPAIATAQPSLVPNQHNHVHNSNLLLFCIIYDIESLAETSHANMNIYNSTWQNKILYSIHSHNLFK